MKAWKIVFISGFALLGLSFYFGNQRINLEEYNRISSLNQRIVQSNTIGLQSGIDVEELQLESANVFGLVCSVPDSNGVCTDAFFKFTLASFSKEDSEKLKNLVEFSKILHNNSFELTENENNTNLMFTFLYLGIAVFVVSGILAYIKK